MQSAHQGAQQGAQPQHTKSPACSSAKSVVQSVCVSLLVLTATSKFALATITGRPREEDPNVHDSI